MKARIVFLIIGILLFVELSCRVLWQMLDRTWGFIVPQQVGQLDPELGWSLRPGVRAWSKATGALVEYSVNSTGQRGPELPPEKPKDATRMVILGDSHSFGFGVSYDRHFASLLKGYFKGLDVVNLAVNGYGADQMLLTLTRRGFAHSPDVVLCYIPHFTDFRHLTDSMWRLGKPRFVEKDGGLELVNSPVANNAWHVIELMRLDSFLSEWCRTYEVVRSTIYEIATSAQAIPKQDAPPPPPELVKQANDLGFRIVQEMDRLCRERGVKFVLATRVPDLLARAEAKGIACCYLGNALFNGYMVLPNDPSRHPPEAASGVIAWELTRFLKKHETVPKEHWSLPIP